MDGCIYENERRKKLFYDPIILLNLNKIDVDCKNVKIYIFNNGIINNIYTES